MVLSYCGSGTVYYKKVGYKCDLYMNKEVGGILLKINDSQAISDFLLLPIDIEYLSGELDTGFRFTLIKCSRYKTENKISENKSVFSYSAEFLVEGLKGEENNITFDKMHFVLNNIIKWGDISGYIIDENLKITKNYETEKEILKNEEYTIKYCVKNSILPINDYELLNEHICLDQQGVISIISNHTHSLSEFICIFTKIKRLIEISILNSINLSEIIGYNKSICYDYEDMKIPRPLNIISSLINKNKESENTNVRISEWIRLPELLRNHSFNMYFDKYNLLEPIIDLFIEAINSDKISAVRRFLNIVQALETYHSRFITNDVEVFKNRIDNTILSQIPESDKKQYRRWLMANTHKFITLKSRLADLLIAEFKIIFDTGDIKRWDFPTVIAQTRNYYIHYDEKIKKENRILSEDELPIYNEALIYILEYYVLKELGFTDKDEIRKKLNRRWGNVSEILSIQQMSEQTKKIN